MSMIRERILIVTFCTLLAVVIARPVTQVTTQTPLPLCPAGNKCFPVGASVVAPPIRCKENQEYINGRCRDVISFTQGKSAFFLKLAK
jgi:hypothetical protein